MKRKLLFLFAFLLFFQLVSSKSQANSTDLNLIIKEDLLIIEAKEKIVIKEIKLNNEKKDLTEHKYYSEKEKSISLEKNQKLSFENTYPSSIEYEIIYSKNGEVNILTDTVNFNKNIIIENLNQDKMDILKPGEVGSLSFEIKNNQNSDIKDLEIQYLDIDSLKFLGTNKIEKITFLASMDKKVINYDILINSSVKENILKIPVGLKYKLGQNLVEEKLIIKLPVDVSDISSNKSISENAKYLGNVQTDISLPQTNSTRDSLPNYNIGNDGRDLSSSSGEVVQVSGSQDIKNKPKLIVDNYTFNPKPLKAGEDFDLTISFFNTNNKKRINNIRIVLNSDISTSTPVEEDFKTSAPSYSASVFTPVNSSNTFYIDYIQPKSRMEKKVTLSTPRDLKPQTYELQIALDYEDSQGNEFTTTEVVGIPIIQDTDIQIGDIEVPTELEVGMSDSVNVDFYNTGRSPIYNLMIRLEGNFDTMSATEYYGNFQPGNSDQYSVMITPIEEGEENGAVIFTYENVNGDSHEIRKNFTVESVDFSENMDDEIIDSENDQKPFYQSVFFYVLILILILVVAYIIYYRKKKSSKERYSESLDLDE